MKTKTIRSIIIWGTMAVFLIIYAVFRCMDAYNALHMIDEAVNDFSEHKSGFKVIASYALEYYENANKANGNLKHITFNFSYSNSYIQVYHFYYDEELNKNYTVQLEWNDKLRKAYDHVDKAFEDPNRFGEFGDNCIIFITDNQVEFSRGAYAVVYRANMTRPDSDEYYVARMSGWHWYQTYSKDAMPSKD